MATWPGAGGASASMQAPETAAVRAPVSAAAPITAAGMPVSGLDNTHQAVYGGQALRGVAGV